MLKIEVLYPEICNLYGEMANMRYLKQCLDTSGVSYSVTETAIKDQPLFVTEKPDLIYMGTMSEKSQEIVIQTLLPYREKIIDRINDNTLFLITGNALEIWGHAIMTDDGMKIPCLNLFNTIAKRKMFDRFNSLYWGKFPDQETQLDIFGFKSQFAHSFPEESCASLLSFEPMMMTQRGPGLNPDLSGEGFRVNRFMATYVIGPLLVLNPLFTAYLLKQMGISKPQLAFKEAAMICYEERKKEFTDPNCGFYYH